MSNHVWMDADNTDYIDNTPHEAVCVFCGCKRLVSFTETGISVEFFEKNSVLRSAEVPPCDDDPFEEYAEITGPTPDIDINREK